MSYMKEKFTEAQEAFYNSYLKLIEARDALQSGELKEYIILERYGSEFTKLSSSIDFAVWLFERSDLFEELGIYELHEATYCKEENKSETYEEGA